MSKYGSHQSNQNWTMLSGNDGWASAGRSRIQREKGAPLCDDFSFFASSVAGTSKSCHWVKRKRHSHDVRITIFIWFFTFSRNSTSSIASFFVGLIFDVIKPIAHETFKSDKIAADFQLLRFVYHIFQDNWKIITITILNKLAWYRSCINDQSALFAAFLDTQ